VVRRGALLAVAAGGVSAAGYAFPTPGARAAAAVAGLVLGAVVLLTWPGIPAPAWMRPIAAARTGSA
jgi:hypothetical protein